jgi:hypothetical protein
MANIKEGPYYPTSLDLTPGEPEKPTPPPKQRFCRECRHYALMWLGFCCFMGGLVVPLIIIRVNHIPETTANIFALIGAVAGLSAYLYFKPSEIRKADQRFADMGYHDHYHV